ncbi:hypothetical protein [Nostoc sp. T09]|nr:hypothetical protein [Nostoc sp. T09]
MPQGSLVLKSISRYPTFSPTIATPSHKTADFSRLTKESAIA